MERIGLAETIEALRAELGEALERATGQAIQFPLGEVRLEFRVGVTKDATTTAGVRFWVLQLGGEAGYVTESIQTPTITLEPPLDARGHGFWWSEAWMDVPDAVPTLGGRSSEVSGPRTGVERAVEIIHDAGEGASPRWRLGSGFSLAAPSSSPQPTWSGTGG